MSALNKKKDLATLKAISSFGRCLYSGQYFSIKFRRSHSEELNTKLQALKARYPELIIYKAYTTKAILFGGTFHVNSQFLADKDRVLGK